MKRIGLIFLLLISSIVMSNISLNATEELLLSSDAKSAILMEMTTRTIIYEKNADEVRAPASMTKIMTMYLVMEALEQNKIDMDTIVIASENATKMGGSQIYLEVGEEMSVEDLFKAVCISSANDAAVALAEHIGGSYENFIKMMNDKASTLGLTNTTFKNANGLPEEGHHSTARDIAILSADLLEKYGSTVLEYTNIYEDYVRKGTEKEIWLVNTNKLIKFSSEVDGLKTGWTDEAGYCLSATMKKDGVRYIAVAMGCTTSKLRNQDIMQMLNYASSNYTLTTICAKDEIVKTFESIKIKPNVYNLVVAKDINILTKKGVELGKIRKEIDITFDEQLIANQNAGTIKVYLDDKLIAEVELEVLETLEKNSFINVFFEVIKEMFLISN